MVKQDMKRINMYKKLVDKLKAHPDNIEHTEAPIRNKDILKLLELSKITTKTEAIQFAVKFTIDNFGLKAVSLSHVEEKLEKLRYAQEKEHELSNELIDA